MLVYAEPLCGYGLVPRADRGRGFNYGVAKWDELAVLHQKVPLFQLSAGEEQKRLKQPRLFLFSCSVMPRKCQLCKPARCPDASHSEQKAAREKGRCERSRVRSTAEDGSEPISDDLQLAARTHP